MFFSVHFATALRVSSTPKSFPTSPPSALSHKSSKYSPFVLDSTSCKHPSPCWTSLATPATSIWVYASISCLVCSSVTLVLGVGDTTAASSGPPRQPPFSCSRPWPTTFPCRQRLPAPNAKSWSSSLLPHNWRPCGLSVRPSFSSRRSK